MSQIKKKTREIIVFTDGSCLGNGTKNSKCGYGIYFPNGELKNISRSFLHVPLTNQRAELYAIYKAIRIIAREYDFENIQVYSDSNYSIQCVTTWIKGWKKNGWQTANKKPVLNVDIIQRIDKYMQKYKNKIHFTHVKAHTGKKDFFSQCNDAVDKLARDGCAKN
jgi:ribonuclease HI